MVRRFVAVGFVFACAAWATACSEKKSDPSRDLRSMAHAPLAPLDGPGDAGRAPEERDLAYRVAPAAVLGEAPPSTALRVSLGESRARAEGEELSYDDRGAMQRLKARVMRAGGAVVLAVEGEAFLAQVAPALAALDDLAREARAEVWLQHPAEPGVAFPLLLRDEAAFNVWLDEPKLGKVRVIQRADGFELMTNIGKLPGADPNGPTVPVRGGQMDIAQLRRGLGRLKERFSKADDACLVPSFGTDVQAVARALSGFWAAAGEPIFSQVCLVYPRPAARGGDGGR